MRIYFDNASTTALEEEVIQEMTHYMKNTYGNPSSIHADGRSAKTAIEKARRSIANHLGASIGEIFFTSGGTESNNMALHCAVRDLGVKRIISSPTEHHCIIHTLDELEKRGMAEVFYLNVDKCGRVDYQQLEELLDASDEKTLVSLMYVNNEIGTLHDIDKISSICHEKNAFFHCDSVQAIGQFPIDLSKINMSFLSGSAHKFHGPKGVGFIYINSNNIILPYIHGGAQERNMRAGTENIYGIVGMAKALDLAIINRTFRIERIHEIRQHMKTQILNNFDNVKINGCEEGFSPKVLSVSFPPHEKNDMLLLLLDMHNISASGGSACSSGVEQASHVLEAINAPLNYKTIRFSFNHHNTIEEVDKVIEVLKEILA